MSVAEKAQVVRMSAVADSVQKGWEVAKKCREQDESDIVAIQKVYKTLPPPAHIHTVATIVGAVYADTYWSRTKMDQAILSASLQKNGWSKSASDLAAKAAFENWRGMFLRNDFQNEGSIPKTGGVTMSPDALCNQDGPLLRETILKFWNSYFFGNPVVGKNYCYVRGQSRNIPLDITKAKARMFWTDAGFNQPPTSWHILSAKDSEIFSPLEWKEPGPIPPTERAASGDFIFEPPKQGHYCLISLASTEFFKNNPLEGTGNWSSQEWITNNGAAGWRNINANKDAAVALKFYNQDDRAELFLFEAECDNVPEGTEIALECQDPGLDRALTGTPVKVFSSHQVVRTGEVLVPALFSGELTARIETPDGKPLPADASVHVRMLWTLPHGHAHYDQAVEQTRAYGSARAARPIRVEMGSYTFVGPQD